jgi:hypothetical protein
LTKTARGILRGIQAKAITNKLILGESAGEVAMKAGARTARGCQGSGLSPHRGGAWAGHAASHARVCHAEAPVLLLARFTHCLLRALPTPHCAVIAILVILGCIGVVVYFGYIQSPKGK